MRTENAVLMTMARESLKGKWGLAIGVSVVYILLIGAVQVIPIAGAIASLLIGGPLALGFAMFALSISRNQQAEIGQLFKGFNNFGTALGAYLLVALFTLLWMLLLIVPGIIAALSYSMTYYILVDNPEMGANAAIDKSKQMMYGYKWKFFCLGLRFIGWALLCVLTLGIGFLWLMPYMQVSVSKFYDDIKDNPIQQA